MYTYNYVLHVCTLCWDWTRREANVMTATCTAPGICLLRQDMRILYMCMYLPCLVTYRAPLSDGSRLAMQGFESVEKSNAAAVQTASFGTASIT